MSLQCRCSQPLWSLGVPDCYPVLAPIRRIIFTTDLGAHSDPGNIFGPPSAWPQSIKYITPTLYNVESERPDPVTEELSGTAFYVRSSPRGISALLVKPPAEFLRNIEAMRCKTKLGVYLLDQNGVLWGKRVGPDSASAIPIEPQTLSIQMLFPSEAATPKAQIRFTLSQNFADFELVPVIADTSLLTFTPLIPVDMILDLLAPNPPNPFFRVRVYSNFAQSAGNLFIPHSNLAYNQFSLLDNLGVAFPAADWTFNNLGQGLYNFSWAGTGSFPSYVKVLVNIPSDPVFDYSTAVVEVVQ